MEKRRTQVTHVRLNHDELEQFKRAAASLEIKPSRLHRKLIREASGCGPDFIESELAPVRETVKQLAAIGRNLNQITRKINAGERTAGLDAGMVEELAEYVHAATEAVFTVVEKSRVRWVPDGDE